MLKNYSAREMVKIVFICSFSLFTLFLGFYLNFWHVADQQWFDNHQRDMENHIIGRMVKSRQDGIFSEGGLTGIGVHDTTLKSTPNFYNQFKPFSDQPIAYINGQSFEAYRTYNSVIGGQGMFFSILDKSLPLSSLEKLDLFHALTSLLSAIALTAIILWFYLEFGLTVAIFVLLSAVFSQWIVVFGRNLYWSMWAFFLPVAAIMYFLRSKKLHYSFQNTTLGIIVFVTVLIKCLFNGMEYITSTLVMLAVPLVYYSILNRLSFQTFLQGLLTAASGSILAIVASFLILCFQIGSVQGKFADGVKHIVYSFEKRTYANPQDFPPRLAASFESSPVSVIAKYWNGTFFNANNYLSCSNSFISENLLKIHYSHLILLFLIMSGILYFFKNIRQITGEEQRIHLALIGATWFSILAPLSWFIVFKAHSFIHTGINFIVWQMPFIFFGFAVCGLVVRQLLISVFDFRRRSTEVKSPNEEV
jgi:hypothetical protein